MRFNKGRLSQGLTAEFANQGVERPEEEFNASAREPLRERQKKQTVPFLCCQLLVPLSLTRCRS
jgi:hypothetical protein